MTIAVPVQAFSSKTGATSDLNYTAFMGEYLIHEWCQPVPCATLGTMKVRFTILSIFIYREPFMNQFSLHLDVGLFRYGTGKFRMPISRDHQPQLHLQKMSELHGRLQDYEHYVRHDYVNGPVVIMLAHRTLKTAWQDFIWSCTMRAMKSHPNECIGSPETDYGITIWGDISATSLNRVQRFTESDFKSSTEQLWL